MQLGVSMSVPRDLDGPEGEIIFIETDHKLYPSRFMGI